MPEVVFQAMRSFLRRSVILPSHCRLLNQIFSCQPTLSFPFRSTFSTRCMNFGNLSNSVQASYARSTGTATSVHRWIGSRRVFLPPDPPPPPPSAFAAILPGRPAHFSPCLAPSTPRSPRRRASSSPFCSVALVSDRTSCGPLVAATALAALNAAGISSSLLVSASTSDCPPPFRASGSSPSSVSSYSSSAIAFAPRSRRCRVRCRRTGCGPNTDTRTTRIAPARVRRVSSLREGEDRAALELDRVDVGRELEVLPQRLRDTGGIVRAARVEQLDVELLVA